MAFNSVGPGPESAGGLAWLARVGASPLEPLALAMGWGERVTRDHVQRLERAGLVERVRMRWGNGSLIVLTSRGAIEAGYPAAWALRSVGPTTWAHATAGAWTSAWMGLRIETRFAPGPNVAWWGERDVANDNFWWRDVRFKDHRGTVQLRHRPDLGVQLGGLPLAVEVELQRKKRPRLRGILGMYLELSTAAGAPYGGVIYVTGTEDIADALRRAADDVGLGAPQLSFRSLTDVIDQTRTAAAERAAANDRPDVGDAA